MKEQINSTFTLSSFYASDIAFNFQKLGDSFVINDLEFSLDTKISKDDKKEDRFSIVYVVSMKNKDNSMKLSTNYHAVFVTKEPVTEELLKSEIIRVNASAIGFPFLRSFISQLSVNCGLPAIILPTINFTKFHKTSTL